jgi:hypothetical protein
MAKGNKIAFKEENTRPKGEMNRILDDTRPPRSSVGGRRDKLSVQGKDPNYEYRFVKDIVIESQEPGKALVAKPGQRITQFLDDGWTFVQSEEVVVGDNNVYKTENLGSIVKVPAGNEEYLYLMKIRKDWYDHYQKELADRRLNVDEIQTQEGHNSGLYGSVKFE